MSDTSAVLKNRQVQIDFEQVYGVSKFLLFLANRIPADQYEQLLKYQLEFYEHLAEESQRSS
jgi:hypothetical protein